MKIDLKNNVSSPNFGRKLTSSEIKKYSNTVKQGFKVLNKEFGMIVHNSSAPSLPKENLGIGSLLSRATATVFFPFLATQGISAVQQEPDTYRLKTNPSPYSPQSSSKNTYMMPLEKLATEEYGYLIKPENLNNFYIGNSDEVDYDLVQKNYNKIFTLAYQNFKNLNFDETKHDELINSFSNYKTNNLADLEANAIYEILAQKHNEENWKKWPKEDKFLYTNKSYDNRRNELIKRYSNDIDFHIFKQWLVNKEIQNLNKINADLGIKIIGDMPVAFSSVDVWRNNDLFMQKMALGCPPDAFSSTGQKWGFDVLKPETLFNPDGSLGKGGELMKKRYEKIFESSSGGVRIDHVIGLIDPFVYTIGKKMSPETSGRLYSSPDSPILSQYARKEQAEYETVLRKIIFPAAEKYGFSQNDIIFEDLGDYLETVARVMNDMKLAGIKVTEFNHRGKDAPAKDVIMLGSHDNQSFLEYTENIYNDAKKRKISSSRKWEIDTRFKNLAEDFAPKGTKASIFESEIRNDKLKFIKFSFAELLTSPAKKVQIFFTDFFGIPKTYNKPGKKKNCWTLRVPENFENLYYENLKKGTAFNIPEALAIAIRKKGSKFVNQNKELLKNLDEFTLILKN